jgi:spore coat polysaccharide biosynthesis predicted glycosyltransferase SpsG
LLKIAIFTEAGSGHGYGHLSRCTALKQGFEEFGVCTKVYVRGDLADRDDVVKTEWLDSYEALFANFDVIVIDSYHADKRVYEEAAKSAKLGVWFDDTSRIDYPEGYLIDGKNSVLLRKAFFAPNASCGGVGKKIFISFGGTDQGALVAQIASVLRDKFPDFSFIFASKVADEAFGQNDKILVGADEIMVAKAMLECVCAVSAGGQTLLELAALAIPSVAVIIAENQIASTKRCFDNGHILGVVDIKDADWATKAAGMLCGGKKISPLQVQTKSIANDILTKAKSGGL